MAISTMTTGIAPSDERDELPPDQLLPTQFADLLGHSGERKPELRLMAAGLEDGIRTFCRFAGAGKGRGRGLFREVADWFESTDTSWPFAFENICAGLDLEPAWIRRLLRGWQARNVPATWLPQIPSVRRIAGTRHAVTARAPGLRLVRRVA